MTDSSPGTPSDASKPVYTSSVTFDPVRLHGAAIYCSDGRFGEQCDEFLQNHLNMPRYDRVVLPGGPGCLAGHPEAVVYEPGVAEELRFLVEVHGLERVVLISHHNCGFYQGRLGLEQPALEAQQRKDMAKAAAYVRKVTGVDNVEAYFARPVGDKVTFEAVPLGE